MVFFWMFGLPNYGFWMSTHPNLNDCSGLWSFLWETVLYFLLTCSWCTRRFTCQKGRLCMFHVYYCYVWYHEWWNNSSFELKYMYNIIELAGWKTCIDFLVSSWHFLVFWMFYPLKLGPPGDGLVNIFQIWIIPRSIHICVPNLVAVWWSCRKKGVGTDTHTKWHCIFI